MKSRKNRNCPDATFMWLNAWFKEVFQNLGWMVLAKSKGMTYKVREYKQSVEKLKCSLKKKLSGIHDFDKKEDLMLMYENICILEQHVKKDFR